MTFDELVLRNFGVYGGEQRIVLSPPSKDKPIVLFGGLNGSGKTTLLDGLQLALYGKRAKCSNRGRMAYDEFLRRCIHKGFEEACVELLFSNRSEGEEHTFRIVRSWALANNTVREQVSILRDGEHDDVLTDSWEDYVEEFMPLGISPLFLFDGEKIETLADPANAADVLRAALHGLLGLDIVDRLTADIRVIERRRKLSESDSTTREKYTQAKQALDSTEAELAKALRERASVKNKVERLGKELQVASSRCRNEGGDYYEQREKLEMAHFEAKTRVRAEEENLRQLAAGSTPLLLIPDLLASTLTQANKEAESELDLRVASFLEERDEQLLRRLFEVTQSNDVIEVLRTFLDADRKARSQHSSTQDRLEISEEGLARLRSLVKSDLAERRNDSAAGLKRLERASSHLVNLDRKLEAVPDRDVVVKLLEKRDRTKASTEQMTREWERLDMEVDRLRREQDTNKARVESILKTQVGQDLEREDSERIVRHAERVHETLSAFRGAVLRKHLERIESFVFDSFCSLIRKPDFVDSLKIDPETFEIHLYASSGDELASNRLSAGERQLLAVSLLWGLAHASGRSLPAVIDTPLGRLDSSHRMNLVEHYFPKASHQVLLLSTDEEIDRSYYDVLEPSVGHEYRLEFDSKLDSTQVKQGYFAWS